MRTATIEYRTHDGKRGWVTSRDVPLFEQQAKWKELRVARALNKTHPDYAWVGFQESDGELQELTFLPEAESAVAKKSKK